MNKITSLVALGLLAGASASAIASAWNFSPAGNNEAAFFFDAESVERSKGSTTIWVKKVQIDHPDKQGAWATASRWRIDCQRKTIQILTSSDYDQNGTFIKSYPNASPASDVIPDSIGDNILKMACKPKFPKNIADKDFFRVEDNDVFRATKAYAEYLNSQKDSAPK